MFKLYFSPSYWKADKHQKAAMRIRADTNLSEYERSKELIDIDPKLSWAEKLLMKTKLDWSEKKISELDYWKTAVLHETSDLNKKMAEAHVRHLEGLTTYYQMHVETTGLILGPGLPFEHAKNDLALRYEEITQAEYDKRKIDLDAGLDTVDKELKKLEYDFDNGAITELEARKGVATINKEPFISVSSVYDPAKGVQGLSFSFEWNDFWVKTLDEAGYRGDAGEMMNHWFMDICRSAILEESLTNPETTTNQKIIKRVVEDNISYIS